MQGGVAEVGSTANKYEILAKLATGGMAEIFLARGASVAGVERYVVLKRILRDRANDAHFVQMFLEEARLAAQLNHPNVAQVFDIGKLGDSYFFTMEYVHGETVRNLLHRARSLRREIPLSCILTVIAGAAAGLHHAHARIGLDGRPLGIVHRDVSPSNLMISYEGSVKVVDFGVAKADNRATETASGAVKGKISYLSPEQISGVNVDKRSDMFALGIVLWEMLTSERLYRRASDFENMNAIVNEPPEVPSRWRAGLPRELDEMSIRLLSKRSEERYQTGDELVEAIEEIAGRVGAQLSTAALGRFMRELFGQRPEPWHEVEFVDRAPDGVTVTNEPIPRELMDPVEHDLANVRDLSRQYAAVGSQSANPGTPVPPVQPVRPMTQRVTVHAMASHDLDNMKTIGLHRDDLMKTIQDRSPDVYAAMQAHATVPMQGAQTIRSTPPPPLGHPSTAQPSSTGPARRGPVAVAMPVIAPAQPRPKSSVPIVVGIVAVLAVIATIGAIVATRSPDKAAAVATDPAEGSAAVVEPGPGGSAAVVEPAPVVVVPVDAFAVAAVAVDASAVAAVAVDASVVAVAVDAGAVVAVDASAVVAVVPASTRSEKITSAYGAARYDEVVTLCRDGVGDRVHLCTIAACHAGDAAHAKSWLARVDATKRAAVQAECKDAGLDLAVAKVKQPVRPDVVKPDVAKPDVAKPNVAKPDPGKDCAKDPMACQH